VVTDGAVDSQGGEGWNQLLQSNRELIKETRALRAQSQQLDQQLDTARWGARLVVLGFAIGIGQNYINLPYPATNFALLCVVAGVLYSTLVLEGIIPVKDPDTDTSGGSTSPPEQESAK
jgi:hypothetical protein